MSGQKILAGLRQAISHARLPERVQTVVVLPERDLPEWMRRGARVLVRGEDFEPYEGVIVSIVRKLNGKPRIVVEDRGRLFIQRPNQLQQCGSFPIVGR